MTQAGDDTDFTQEALSTQSRSEIGGEDLERHPPSMPAIQRQVDRPHPSSAELALDRVATPESRRKAGEGV
jgi:hypothetical protein